MRQLLFFPVLLLFLITSSLQPSSAHNITKILADHPEFSTFNHYLTLTHLAAEINRRLTITVLAVDNAGMSSILSKHLSLPTLKNVLSLHVLVDYYGAKKLHQLTGGSALSSSFFQATGAAPGTTGFVNITDHRKGRVTFLAEDDTSNGSPSSFVKSVKELPYNISVVQISTALSSSEAEAPSAAPAPVNLTSVLSKNGCKLFADLISSTADVASTYQDTLDGGLTVFCPVDAAVKAFAPKFKNLTADHKVSLLLYHADPVYNSLQMLKNSNGVTNTLATDGRSKNFNYTIQNDGEVVTVETRVTTAKIVKTVLDQDPVAIFSVDKVLQPSELFKVVKAEAPAPEAEAPAADKKKKKKKKGDEAPEPAGPEEAPADQKAADENAAVASVNRSWFAAAVALAAAAAVVIV